jgi:glutathione synthase/RimK-type ligase-like ATP-grasp enzyme
MRASGLATMKDVVRPRQALPAQRTYVDFIFGLDYLSVNSKLLQIMHQAMAARGLSCLLVNHASVERTIASVRKGRLRPLVYLDLCSRPGDAFYGLLETLSARGATTFCNPNTIGMTLKVNSHLALERAGLPLPPTVILKRTDPDRELTSEELARVGDRVVIKPSFGVAGEGVVVGVSPTREQIAKARDFKRDEDWLIQRMITWTKFGDRQAYLRGYNVLGHRSLMWWSNDRGYHPLTWNDLRKYDLLGAVYLVDRIAAVTGVEYFSSEIAITAESGKDRFCLIDQVNDQSDIDLQAQPDRSPPEAWVRWVCGVFAEYTWRKKHGLPEVRVGNLHLAPNP